MNKCSKCTHLNRDDLDYCSNCKVKMFSGEVDLREMDLKTITKQELSTAQSLAPLLSEGAISLFQVSRMSKREQAQREKNIQIRYDLEYKYKRQNMTAEEIQKEKIEEAQEKKDSRICQIKSQMELIKDFTQMKTKRDNSLKRTYRGYEEELKILLNIDVGEFERGLN